MKQKKVLGVAAVTGLTVLQGLASASETGFECHAFTDSMERLACYDEMTRYGETPVSPETTDGVGTPGAQWQFSDETSALDGRRSVWLSVQSENTELNSIGRPLYATLWVRCMNNRTNVVIGFDRYTSDDQSVRYRLDDGAVAQQWMQPIRGGEGIGIWSGARAIPFTRQLFGKERLVLGYNTYSGPVEFMFPISGLRARIAPLATSCNWTP